MIEMTNIDAYIAVAKTVTLVCGGLVTIAAGRAYVRTGSRALRALAVGLGLVTLGSLLAGTLYQFGVFGLGVGVAVQSSFTALGFLVLTYSLYADGAAETRTDERVRPAR